MIPTLITIVVVMTVLLALAQVLNEAADHERPRVDE